DRPSSWESRLPPELLRLPEELARGDALLDDPAFFAPFAPHFHPVIGRPSTPAEWYLRLMFGKFRYRLGLEGLCAEVSDPGLLAAVLPDPAGREGAAPDDADEADYPVRGGRGGRAERGAVGQGGRGQTAAHRAGTRRYYGGRRERRLSDGLRAAGHGGGQDGPGGAAGAGRRPGHPAGADGPAA